MPTVRLEISPTPAHVRTVRLVTTAIARRSGLTDGVLDEIRLAVGEACSRAVNLHQAFAPTEMITVLLEDAGKFVVTVCDCAPAGSQTGQTDALEFLANVPSGGSSDSDMLPSGLGMAVIDGLVDDLIIEPAADGPGTVVRMSWPLSASAEHGLSRA
ncbi:MAG: ATP-binding protein [Mycobacteriales bacterium]